jgi:hypothetical protein
MNGKLPWVLVGILASLLSAMVTFTVTALDKPDRTEVQAQIFQVNGQLVRVLDRLAALDVQVAVVLQRLGLVDGQGGR